MDELRAKVRTTRVKKPHVYKIIGLVSSVAFQRAKRVAQMVRWLHPKEVCDPQFIPLLERDWKDFVDDNRMESGGRYWEPMNPVAVFETDKFIGDDVKFIDMMWRNFSYDDEEHQYSPERLANEAILEYCRYLTLSKKQYVFMEIGVNYEPIGNIVFELHSDIAPCTCENFRSLCASGKEPQGKDMSKVERLAACLKGLRVAEGEEAEDEEESEEESEEDEPLDEREALLRQILKQEDQEIRRAELEVEKKLFEILVEEKQLLHEQLDEVRRREDEILGEEEKLELAMKEQEQKEKLILEEEENKRHALQQKEEEDTQTLVDEVDRKIQNFEEELDKLRAQMELEPDIEKRRALEEKQQQSRNALRKQWNGRNEIMSKANRRQTTFAAESSQRYNTLLEQLNKEKSELQDQYKKQTSLLQDIKTRRKTIIIQHEKSKKSLFIGAERARSTMFHRSTVRNTQKLLSMIPTGEETIVQCQCVLEIDLAKLKMVRKREGRRETPSIIALQDLIEQVRAINTPCMCCYVAPTFGDEAEGERDKGRATKQWDKEWSREYRWKRAWTRWGEGEGESEGAGAGVGEEVDKGAGAGAGAGVGGGVTGKEAGAGVDGGTGKEEGAEVDEGAGKGEGAEVDEGADERADGGGTCLAEVCSFELDEDEESSQLRSLGSKFASTFFGPRGSKRIPLPLSYRFSPIHRIAKLGWIEGGYLYDLSYRASSIYGPTFEDESFATKHDKRGVLGMINEGPHSNSSLFYITLKPSPWMDRKFVAFGRIVEGMSVLTTIEAEDTYREMPHRDIRIIDCGELNINKILSTIKCPSDELISEC